MDSTCAEDFFLCSAKWQGAHEAEISYLRILGFTEKYIQFADQIR